MSLTLVAQQNMPAEQEHQTLAATVPSPAAVASATPAINFEPQPTALPLTHRFLDRSALIALAFNVGAQSIDAYTTHKFLTEHTGVEVNPFARLFVTHGWKGQIAYSYGLDVGGTLAAGYWLHRHNHHKLERWMPYLVGVPTLACGLQNFRLLK